MNSSQLTSLRNVMILFGLWITVSILAGIAAYGTNFLPGYIASSNRPGSVILMNVISILALIPFAAFGGFVIRRLLMTSRPRGWALALVFLFAWQSLVSHSFGWGWVRMEWEMRVGVPLAAGLLGLATLAGFWVSERRVQRKANGEPA